FTSFDQADTAGGRTSAHRVVPDHRFDERDIREGFVGGMHRQPRHTNSADREWDCSLYPSFTCDCSRKDFAWHADGKGEGRPSVETVLDSPSVGSCANP